MEKSQRQSIEDPPLSLRSDGDPQIDELFTALTDYRWRCALHIW